MSSHPVMRCLAALGQEVRAKWGGTGIATGKPQKQLGE